MGPNNKPLYLRGSTKINVKIDSYNYKILTFQKSSFFYFFYQYQLLYIRKYYRVQYIILLDNSRKLTKWGPEKLYKNLALGYIVY